MLTVVKVQDKNLRGLVLQCLCQCFHSYLGRLGSTARLSEVNAFLTKHTKPMLQNLRKNNLQQPDQHVGLWICLPFCHLIWSLHWTLCTSSPSNLFTLRPPFFVPGLAIFSLSGFLFTLLSISLIFRSTLPSLVFSLEGKTLWKILLSLIAPGMLSWCRIS